MFYNYELYYLSPSKSSIAKPINNSILQEIYLKNLNNG